MDTASARPIVDLPLSPGAIRNDAPLGWTGPLAGELRRAKVDARRQLLDGLQDRLHGGERRGLPVVRGPARHLGGGPGDALAPGQGQRGSGAEDALPVSVDGHVRGAVPAERDVPEQERCTERPDGDPERTAEPFDHHARGMEHAGHEVRGLVRVEHDVRLGDVRPIGIVEAGRHDGGDLRILRGLLLRRPGPGQHGPDGLGGRDAAPLQFRHRLDHRGHQGSDSRPVRMLMGRTASAGAESA